MIELRRRIMGGGSVGEDYVDLGLPSGALWAKCNIGADNPWEAGQYFSWSNTEGHYASEGYNFSSDNYSNTLGSKLRRNPFWGANSLLGEDGFDAARENIGDWWFVPRRDHYVELVDNTDQEWVSNYQNTGVSGMKFINRNNSSKYIFMPEVGYYSGTTYTKDSDYSRYWMADRVDDGNDRPNAKFFRFYSDGSTNCNGYNFLGYVGCQIRPVYKEPGNNWDFKTTVMFQIKALESGTIGWRCNVDDSAWFKKIQYSKNGGAFTIITSSYSTNGTTISVDTGDIVKFNAPNTNIISENVTNCNRFTSTCRCEVSGNIMLLYSNIITTKPQNVRIPTDGLFCTLFQNNTKLVSAENLYLPAHTLTSNCYRGMFYQCTNLTTAPELPATTLADYCYYEMFYGCTSLTNVPNLPATTLANYCYLGMFRGCTSLTTVPSDLLPATTLASNCYQTMFFQCTNLTTAPELPATTLAFACYYYMFTHCTSLTTVPELPATTMADYCYQSIFESCTSLTTVPSDLLPATTLAYSCYRGIFYQCTNLTTAPELPATTLVNNCYYHLFCGCTSLNYIKCLATNISASNCLYHWVENVAQSGTFVKEDGVEWTIGVSGIPESWVQQTHALMPDLSTAISKVEDQKYTGSALTPVPKVVVDGIVLNDFYYTVSYSNNINVGTATITVTHNNRSMGEASGTFEIIVQQTGTVSFANNTIEKNEGDTAFTNVITKNSDGAVSYTSSNTNVATVNGSGLVTIVGVGTASITVTVAETARYSEATDSFALAVHYVFDENETRNYAYTGSKRTVGLSKGIYKLIVCGAQGGSRDTTYIGGKGGRSEGVINIGNDTKTFVYVGGQGGGGTTTGIKSGGFNGGGNSYSTSSSYYHSAGGGGSDIRIGTDSLYARVMVAGGGGGSGDYNASNHYNGGHGSGTANGKAGGQYSKSYIAGQGGTQTAGGTSYDGTTADSTTNGTLAGFGVGGGSSRTSGTSIAYNISGGGGGWYGGGHARGAGAGGGSGYVYTSSTASNYPSGCLLNSSHYLSNTHGYYGSQSGDGQISITKLSFVDLGLPSGLLWAKGNLVKDSSGNYSIGNETDQGIYCSWGNIDGYNESDNYDFNSSNYSSSSGNSLSADIPTKDSSYDIAYAKGLNPWYLPTTDNFQELYDNTDYERTTINGVAGIKFMKKTDHSIYVFLPAWGWYNSTTLNGKGTEGYYRTSTYYSSTGARVLYYNENSVSPDYRGVRSRGGSIRPVFSLNL